MISLARTIAQGLEEDFMRHSYYIDVRKQDDAVLDELLVLVMKQARISSRRRTRRWDMRLDKIYLCARFYLKGDYEDFVSAFEKENVEFLTLNGFIEAEIDSDSESKPAVPTFDWHGYINHVTASSRRQ